MADTSIVASALETTTQIIGSFTIYPPAARDPNLDQVFDCLGEGPGEADEWGLLSLTLEISGEWQNVNQDASDALGIVTSIHGTFEEGVIFSSDSVFTVTLGWNEPEIITEASKRNWVKWSNIGALDFTVWKDNVAGERPLDWNGFIYSLKKLANRVIAYGENGVSMLSPAGNAWGLQNIHHFGLIGQNAVCGNDSQHFFVDSNGSLCRLTDSIEMLDYREYLSNLGSSTVLSFDENNHIVYICDGMYGYVYSTQDKSLGEGPVNITGIGYQSGVFYAVAPYTITTSALEVCTDIYDFGTRKGKTIRSVEIGTDLSAGLSCAIEYRRDKSSDFETTEFRTVNAQGVAFITCYGNEFRFRIKSASHESFAIDYITINGQVHDY